MQKKPEKSQAQLLAELETVKKQLNNAETVNAELTAKLEKLEPLAIDYEKQRIEFEQKYEQWQQLEKRLSMSQVIVDRSPVVLFRRLAGEKPDLEYISDNLRQFGYSPEEFLQGELTYSEIVHPDDFEMVRSQINYYAETDVEEYSLIYRILTKNGETRWIIDQTSVVRDDEGRKTHNQGIIVDITQRKLAQDALRKSEEKFRRIVETTAQGFVLTDKDLKIVEVNNAYCRIIGYSEDELYGRAPFELASEENREVMLARKESLMNQQYREFEITAIHKNGYKVPILVHASILTDDADDIIGHMAFITDMTEQKKALQLAGEVQKSLLPQQKPRVTGLDVAGRNISCDEIGGDYYDFLWRKEVETGPFSIVVGDISGHGVESALLMTTARAFLRMRFSQPGTLGDVITAMNKHLARDVLESGKFMTLFCITIDPARRQLTWVRAGHDPAILYDPVQDDFEELKGEGVALGVVDEITYGENEKSQLTNGQIIAIGTDGIWEATNTAGIMFGKERLRTIIRENSSAPARDILNKVYDSVGKFTRGQAAEDDRTLVIMKIES